MRCLLVGLISAGLLAVMPPVASAAVTDCNVYAFYPNVKISSARNMSCAEARRAMRRHRGSIATRFTTPGGFRCARVSGAELGGQWRCVRRSRAFRFEFGD